jgi:catechol 2,3-dioxygenase-like lactoylglutathione lyase family enzyme
MKRFWIAATAVLAGLSALASDAPPRPKIYGIAFVRMKAADFQKSRTFYEKILGLKSGIDGCKGATNLCIVVNPYQYIELAPAGFRETGTFLDALGLTTSDVELMRDYLAAHGVKTTAIAAGGNGLRFFEAEDPEHNRLAFVEPSGADAHVDGLHQVGNRLFHAGFVVKDLAAENSFYRDVLGFRLYWRGGFKDADTDWYESQVPDGDNWIEYMLNIPASADHQELGVQNHFSVGVRNIHSAVKRLRENGLVTSDGPEIGRDGKWSFDIYDPDGTRVEFMEFTPAQRPCCAEYTAAHPKP